MSTKIDFALAFYMVHEIADQNAFFCEVAGLLKPDRGMFTVEPPFHVSNAAFQKSIDKALGAGLELIVRPKVRFNNTALLGRR